MNIIYAVWHQAEGVVTSYMFAAYPTDEQMECLRRELERRHNRPDMEMRVRLVSLLDADELPQFERPADELQSANVGSLSVFGVSGVGTVTQVGQ